MPTLQRVLGIAAWGLLLVFLAAPGLAVNYTAIASGNINGPVWAPAGVPGPGDTATVPSPFTIEFSGNWNLDALTVTNGGRVIGTTPLSTVITPTVQIDAGAVLRGFDAPGGGGTLMVRAQNLGTLTVQNDGTMRGGHPHGNLMIHDGFGKSTCSMTSFIQSFGGSFLGGSDGGNVFLVAGTIDLDNAVVEGGTGNMPFTFGGSVLLNGHTINLGGSLPGLTRVVSGTNFGGGPGGSVAIQAPACPNISSSLILGPTTFVNVGTPSIGGCPQVNLFSAGTSQILGTVGNQGTNCAFWDPPDLRLGQQGRIEAQRLTIAGETFSAVGLQGTGLVAGQRLDFYLAPGGTLDLRDLEPGEPIFKAGEGINLCVDRILLDPGVHLDELMDPAPRLCRGQRHAALHLTPPLVQRLKPGDTITLKLEATNVGNTPADVEAELHDSADWLVGGAQVQAAYLAPGETLTFIATLEVPTEPEHDLTKLVLNGNIAGQGTQESISIVFLQ